MTPQAEIETNYTHFCADWQQKLTDALAAIAENKALLLASYGRLTSLQAWRGCLLESILPHDAACFFLEAQNDALISHVQMACGSWRSALNALRSCLENALLALFYKDHTVELQQWAVGGFRLSFSEGVKYLRKHPLLHKVPDGITGLALIEQEYRSLSRAVHASSKEFRMTADGKAVSIWMRDEAHFRQWASHEAKVVQGINLLFVAIFREHLTGTRQNELRRAIARSIPKNKDSEVQARLGVRIRRS